MSLTEQQQNELIYIAKESIINGLQFGIPVAVQLSDPTDVLAEPRATFVTLNRQQQLRGCIGSLVATQPLAIDVAENAFNAAFRDPRFTPVTAEELDGLSVHISVLTPAVSIGFTSEWDLLTQLRPHVDGLILEEGEHRATFLPSVWDTLTDPLQFLRHLKQKAGLPGDYWSDSIRVYRYEAEYIG